MKRYRGTPYHEEGKSVPPLKQQQREENRFFHLTVSIVIFLWRSGPEKLRTGSQVPISLYLIGSEPSFYSLIGRFHGAR